MEKEIEGMGKEQEITTNSAGGKQSNLPYAMHLIDPKFLGRVVGDVILQKLVFLMEYGGYGEFIVDIFQNEDNTPKTNYLYTIAKVLKEGAEKYAPNNWRLIPQEEHLNHAICHYLAYLSGDKQDDHFAHFLTRAMMAYATRPSEGFSYTEAPKNES